MFNQYRNRWRVIAIIFLIGAVTSGGALLKTQSASGASPAPPDLRQTGLYSDFASRTVDSRNLHYSPQYPLWSDGAVKQRWIYLPPGKSIDATNPDLWTFPVGTKVWKEFSFDGHRVETRLLEQLGRNEWRFATYAWNADESAAVLVPDTGLRGVAEIQPGIKHDLPGVKDCQACHVSSRTEILGFSALQLSPDRDPQAPHAEPAAPDMANLQWLIQKKLIHSYPSVWAGEPLRIKAPNPRSRAALGYLHANCGNCHNPAGSLESLSIILRHSVAPDALEKTAPKSAINRTGRFRIPDTKPGETFLIRPGDPEHSAVAYRMATRNPFRQMPPLGTKIADAEAVNLISLWIKEDLVRPDDSPAKEP